jgi:hypothetical protein
VAGGRIQEVAGGSRARSGRWLGGCGPNARAQAADEAASERASSGCYGGGGPAGRVGVPWRRRASGPRRGAVVAAGLRWSRPHADEEAAHGPGEAPQRKGCLLSTFGRWASTGESQV